MKKWDLLIQIVVLMVILIFMIYQRRLIVILISTVNQENYTHGINDEESQKECCILVQNNWDKLPTFSTIQLFAYRLYQAERSIDLNVLIQKYPFFILLDESQRLTFINMMSQYQENMPFIFGDKNNLSREQIDCIKTDAPFIANELCNYKKEIWNEALTFLRN